MARRKANTTKHEIIRLATHLFLEKGYRETSPKMISEALDISTGNITYYFPTKDHLLAVLTGMLCRFQWKMMEEEAQEGLSSVMALCLELATMVAICEEDAIAKDFYISTYSSPMCLEIIRKNDAARAKKIFREHRPTWTDEHFEEAEILVSGIEYATLMTEGVSVSADTRIAGALHNILGIYNVPEEVRKAKIQRVLAMDYRGVGRRLLKEFRAFVDEANEQAFAQLQTQ